MHRAASLLLMVLGLVACAAPLAQPDASRAAVAARGPGLESGLAQIAAAVAKLAAIFGTRVLAASIGVMKQPARRTSALYRHLKRAQG